MRAAILVLLLALSPWAAWAQPAAGSPAQETPAASTDRVPVPEPTEQALSYHRSGNVLWVVTTLWGLLIPSLFLFTGFSARIRTWATKIGRKWFFVIAAYWVIFAVISSVIDLPLSYYIGFVREHAYGLSNQTFAKWASDEAKTLIEVRDRTVELNPGECLVVPRGVEHRPVAAEEVELLLFEPAATRNTGNVLHPTLTAPDGAH